MRRPTNRRRSARAIAAIGGLLAAITITPAAAAPLSATEGTQFSGAVAPAPGSCSPSTVQISWGDGTTSTGTINRDGSFSGTHTYPQAGTYNGSVAYAGTVSVQEVTTPCAGAEPFQIQVADAPLSASPIMVLASAGRSFSGPVATFTDANPNAQAGDFTAQVQWGDGTSSAGQVATAGSGFVVNATHTYAANGTYPLVVTVSDRGGAQAQAHSSARISAGGGGSLPGATKPSYGHDGTIRRVSGTVLVRLPGTQTYIPLARASTIPTGSIIDATHGTVQLVSAASIDSRTTQSANFYDGAFEFDQPRGFYIPAIPLMRAKSHGKPQQIGPYTQLRLFGGDFGHCTAPVAGHARATVARATRSPRQVRHLWGSGHGHFITIGRTASAAVRGTVWLTQDRCDGTLTRVVRGIVQVADFSHHRTVAVRAGHQYLASG